MTTNSNKLLNLALIMLLMLAPLRSVFAMQFAACNMNDSASSTAPAMVVDHCQHRPAGMLSAKAAPEKSFSPESNSHAGVPFKSCCGNNGACMSDCHTAMSASLLVRQAEYSAVLFTAETIEADSGVLLVRELNPPFRPPLSLYS